MKRHGLFKLLLAVATVVAGCSDDSAVDTTAPPITASPTSTTTTVATPHATTTTQPGAATLPAPSSCEQLLDAFANHPRVAAGCDGDWLTIAADGFADPEPVTHEFRMMVGITAWILRVPIPFDYQWRIPSEPQWLDAPVEASPRGPIAVAVDGIPIFHYEARPDVSTHIEHYDPNTDTVVQGELDNCGGHSGQGDDYHYHYAPVCLLGQHETAFPIAFGLDGAPIYFGTGGTDRYGAGRFSHVDMLPSAPLDECNAIQLDDGSWVHYTTSTPPYLVGCHHGVVDPSLQIEPRPMRQQGAPSPYGGFVGEPTQTIVTDWYEGDDGWYHLEHESFDGSGTSAIVYRSVPGGDCWEFDFRADADTPGVIETYCRQG